MSATASSALGNGLVHGEMITRPPACVTAGRVTYSRRHCRSSRSRPTSAPATAMPGAMKGVVLSMAPQAQLVDITHGVPPQDVAAGRGRAGPGRAAVPAGDDPRRGRRSRRRRRARRHRGRGGRAAVRRAGQRRAVAWPRGRHGGSTRIEAAAFRREPVSPTFHGRDVFAPTAGRLAAGAPRSTPPARCSTTCSSSGAAAARTSRAASSRGEVIHIDGFGNLITSLPAERCSRRAGAECDRGRGDRGAVRARRSGARSRTSRRGRSSPTSAAAASSRSRAAMARRPSASAPPAARRCACARA